MDVLVCLIVSYLITDFLYFYCYNKLLGRKYSLKIMVLATCAMWLLDCLAKPVPQILFGIENIGILSILTLLTSIFYVILFFQSNVRKRITIMALYILVTILMDALSISITTAIVGDFELYQTGSSYTLIASVCSTILITLGTLMFVWGWKMVDKGRRGLELYQGFCWMLPTSQYVIVQQTATRIYLNGSGIHWLFILGLLLGGLADVYMFHCFIQLNERRAVEAELREMQYQYEMEKLRYGELREKEEEIAKIRHDFGNYVLVMKSMVEKQVED